MSRPFEYKWTFMGRKCLAFERDPGIIVFTEDGKVTDKPLGLTNELVQLVTLVRGLRCDLAALGAHESACQECDDYDPEAIAECPHCHIPVCDGCMNNWHQNGTCCPNG